MYSKPCVSVTLISPDLTHQWRSGALFLLHYRFLSLPLGSRVGSRGQHLPALAPSRHSATPGFLLSPEPSAQGRPPQRLQQYCWAAQDPQVATQPIKLPWAGCVGFLGWTPDPPHPLLLCSCPSPPLPHFPSLVWSRSYMPLPGMGQIPERVGP